MSHTVLQEADVKVQHLTKKSGDDLLRKFAAVDSEDEGDEEIEKAQKRRKKFKCRKTSDEEADTTTYALTAASIDKFSLLQPVRRKNASVFSVGRWHLSKTRDLRGFSMVKEMEKTWRRTAARASRLIFQHHYNRHKRLAIEV